MKWAFHICWASFLFSTFFVAPFLKNKEDKVEKTTAAAIFNANSNTFYYSPFVMGNGNTMDYSQKFFGDTNKPQIKLYALKPYGIPPSEEAWAQCEVKDYATIYVPKGAMIMFCARNVGKKTIAHLSSDMIAICDGESNLITTGLWRQLPPALASGFPNIGTTTFYPHWGIESIHSCAPGIFQPNDLIGVSTNYPNAFLPIVIREYADDTPVFEHHIVIAIQ